MAVSYIHIYLEGAAGLGLPREDTDAGGGGQFCVGYILQRGGPGSSALQVRNMGAISGDGKEAGGIPRGIPTAGHG